MTGCTGKCESCGSSAPALANRVPAGQLLLFGCGGGSNVAEVADQVVRGLQEEGWGAMYCLVGLATAVPGMLQTARNARLNVVLDGCGLDCGRRVFQMHELKNYRQVRLTELGLQKSKSRATQEEVSQILDKVRTMLRDGCLARPPG